MSNLQLLVEAVCHVRDDIDDMKSHNSSIQTSTDRTSSSSSSQETKSNGSVTTNIPFESHLMNSKASEDHQIKRKRLAESENGMNPALPYPKGQYLAFPNMNICGLSNIPPQFMTQFYDVPLNMNPLNLMLPNKDNGAMSMADQGDVFTRQKSMPGSGMSPLPTAKIHPLQYQLGLNRSLVYPSSLAFRREMFSNIVNSFNLNDVLTLEMNLQSYASSGIVVSSQSDVGNSVVGLPSLLIFWLLVLEAYPDAVIRGIKSKELSQYSCEFSFEFVGTRITAHPVSVLYKLAANKLNQGLSITPKELLGLITRSSRESSKIAIAKKVPCPLVACQGSFLLVFDEGRKITHWLINFNI